MADLANPEFRKQYEELLKEEQVQPAVQDKGVAIPIEKNKDGSIKYTFDNIYQDKQLANTIKDYYLYRTGKQFSTDEDAINEYISDSTFRQANTLGAVFGDLSLVGIDDANARQKANLAYLLNYWQNLPNFYEEGGRGFSGFLSNLGYSIIDPINLVGGVVGGVVAKKAGQKVIEKGVAEIAKQAGKKKGTDIILKENFVKEQASKLARTKLLQSAAGIASVDAAGLAISDVFAQTTEKEVGLIQSLSPLRTGTVAVAGAGLSFFASAGTGYITKNVLANLNNTKIKLPKNLQDSIDKTAPAVDEAGNHASNLSSKFSLAKTKYVDQYDYFKLLQEEITGVKGSVVGLKEAYRLRAELPKSKRGVDPALNPYFQLRLTAGSASRSTEFINEGFYLPPSKTAVDASYTKTGNLGLNQILKQYDDSGEVAIFLQYVAAKRQKAIIDYHVRTGKKPPTGLPLSKEEMTKLIDFGEMSQKAYSNKYKEDLTRKGDYLKGLGELKLFTDDALKYLISKEVISEKQAADMKKVNNVFIPLYRTKKKGLLPAKLEEAAIKIAPIGATARQRLAKSKQEGELNLYDNLVNYVYTNIAAADKNGAKVSLYEMLESGVARGKLGANYFTSGSLKGQIKDFTDLDGNVILSRVTPGVEQVNAIGSSVQKALERANVQIVGKNLGDEPMNIAAFSGTVKSLSNPENVLDVVYRNGKATYYEIKDRNFIAAYESIGDKTSDMVNFFTTSPFAKYTRLASRSITYSPPFIAFNAIRDTLAGAVNSAFGITDKTVGFLPGFSTLKGFKDTYTKTDLYRKAFVNGLGYSSRTESTSVLKNAIDDIYSYGADDVSRFYATSLKRVFGKTLGAGWRGYKDFVGRVEYATRFAEYQLAKDAGMSDLGAAFAGREVATDFAMRGSSRYLNAFARNTMFLNAGIQGLYRGGRVLFENPKRSAAVIGLTIVAPEIALYNLNKKYKEYERIDDKIKQLNYLIPVFKETTDPKTGLPEIDTFIAIPKPYDFGVFANIATGLLDGINKNSTYLGGKYALTSMMNLFPGLQAPTPFNPLLELMLNRNFYTGRPIESYYEMTQMSDLKRKTGTRTIAEQISNFTANLKGMVAAEGKEIEPMVGAIQIDYLIRAYATGIMQYPFDIAEHLLYESTRKGTRGELPSTRSDEANIMKNPLSLISRRFFVETPLKKTKFHQDFYDLYTKAKKYKQINLVDIDEKKNLETKLDLFEKFIENKDKYKETGQFQSQEVTNLSAISPILNKVAILLNKNRDLRNTITRDPSLSGIEKQNRLSDNLKAENELIQEVVEQLTIANVDHVFENMFGMKTTAISKSRREALEPKKIIIK